jgi:hypothetical protein
MVAISVKNCAGKILIISPIYDKIDKLQNAINLIPRYDLVIFNGNLCYPHNDSQIQERIALLNTALSTNKVLYNLGNEDLLLLKSTNNPEIKSWLETKPNVIIIEFVRGTYLIITSGGVTPQMRDRADLFDNMETSFVSKFRDKPWHEWYQGRLGYIISNNPLTFQEPQFYNYSAQIGNAYGPDTQVYAQEADENGLQKTILL